MSLNNVAEQLVVLKDQLEQVKSVLPIPFNEREMLEGEEPYDVATDLRGSIECVVDDCFRPAIRTLRKAATVTEAELEEEFRERRFLRGLRPA